MPGLFDFLTGGGVLGAGQQPPQQSPQTPPIGPVPAGQGNPLAAGTIGFFDARNLGGGIGNLIGGLMTGNRQDAAGQEYQNRQAIYQAALPQVGHDQAAALAMSPDVQKIIQGGQIARQQLAQEKELKLLELEKPLKLGPGEELVSPKGETIRGASESGMWDDDTLAERAKQVVAGDPTPYQQAGFGKLGAINKGRLANEVTRQQKIQGMSGTDQALRNAEFFGVKREQAAMGTRAANIRMASTEFMELLPRLTAVVNAVDRSKYPAVNKIINAYLENTGDPGIVQLGGALNTAVNIYARAINPGGIGTVSDKDHARDILQKYWSSGQIKAAFDLMVQEIAAAKASPGKAREEMGREFLQRQGQGGSILPGGEKPIVSMPDIGGWH